MKHFIVFFIRWYSQNLSIPFWIVGHVQLSLNVYDDWKEYGASFLMHLFVFIGFWIDFKEYKESKNEKKL